MDLGRPWVIRVLAVALAVAVGAFVYLAVRGADDEEAAAPAAATGEARIVSADELVEIAAEAGQPVYWAGEMEGTELEVADDEAGVLVRYLREDDEVGAAFGQRIAVGSYAVPNPRKALNNFAKSPGTTVKSVPGVGKVVIGPEARKNVYFVDPGNEVQVEVYAPSAARAVGLVRSGRVQPVG